MNYYKTTGLLFFIISIVFQGCYSYSSISEENILADESLVSRDIKIKLRNGQTIQSGSYQHIIVSQPSDFYFGIPVESRGIFKKGPTILYKTEVISDSTYTDNDIIYTRLNLTNNRSYIFESDKLLRIQPGYGTGLYCKGVISETGNRFEGMLNQNDIADSSIKKLSVIQTIVIPAAITILLFFNIIHFFSFKT